MKKVSCGFLIKNQYGQYLAMLPTGRKENTKHNYDIPKGCRENDDGDFSTACRELMEETGINLSEIEHSEYIDYGVMPYRDGKDIHIFGTTINLSQDFEIKCSSMFIDTDGIEKPEMCDYKWVDNFSWFFYNLEKVLNNIISN